MLRQSLDEMLLGHGSLVLVSGDAGIGKTSLVEDCSRRAEEQESLVLWGHAYDLSVTPPYGPWLEIFRDCGSSLGGSSPLSAFVDGDHHRASTDSREALFASVADFFMGVSAQRPLMLVLDDLHWADQASLDLLRYLARRLTNQRILVVAAYRTDEVHHRHPLYTQLPLLVREAGAERISLRPLTQGAWRALIESRFALDSSDVARLDQYLEDHSEGNPLYAGELLRTLEEDGLLTRIDHRWILADIEQLRVPPLLRQIVETRASRLDHESQRLLAIASVIGQTVPLEIWSMSGGIDDEQLLDVAERAEEAQILAATLGGNSVQFRHALIREALYERIPSIRRRRIHRKVGETLASIANPDPDVVAFHFRRAGDARAADWFIRAAHRAEWAFALRAAADGYEAAEIALDRDATRVELRGWLLYRLAFAKRFLGPDVAIPYLDEMQALAIDTGNSAMRILAQAERGFVLYMGGDVSGSLRELNAALADYDATAPDAWSAGCTGFDAVFPNDPQATLISAERHLTTMMEERRQSLVITLALLGHFREAIDLAERWWPVWTQADYPNFDNALSGCGSAHAALGDAVVAQEMWRQEVEHCQTYHNYVVAGSVLFKQLFWVNIAYFADDRRERRQLQSAMQHQYQLAVDHGNTTLPSPELFHFPVQYVEGEWSRSERAASSLASTVIHPRIPALAVCTLGLLSHHRGNAREAWERVHAMLPGGPTTEPGETLYLESQILQRLAIVLSLEANDLDTTRLWLEAHDRWLKWSGAVIGRAEGELLWARYFAATQSPALARQHAEQALGHASNPRRPLILIAVHRFVGCLDTRDGNLVDAERHVQQSLELAEVCNAPYECALSMLVMAELRISQRRIAAADEILDEVSAICARLGAKPALDRIEALREQLADDRLASPDYPAGLTEREVEVLRLVADGLTDAQVAEHLYLSPRTVSSHLRSVYNKIGVGSRAAASRFAAEHRLI